VKSAQPSRLLRIGQLVGKKYRYLGLYDTEEEAAVAYDTEAVRQKGFEVGLYSLNAVYPQ
jgi:hypothetical protein